MAKTEKYYIGPRLLGDMRDAIARVAGMPAKTSGVSLPVRLQEMPRSPGSALRLGASVGNWPKNSLGNVVLYDTGEALQEEPAEPPVVLYGCVNKLVDVGSGKLVIVGRIAGRWYLVAPECG